MPPTARTGPQATNGTLSTKREDVKAGCSHAVYDPRHWGQLLNFVHVDSELERRQRQHAPGNHAWVRTQGPRRSSAVTSGAPRMLSEISHYWQYVSKGCIDHVPALCHALYNPSFVNLFQYIPGSLSRYFNFPDNLLSNSLAHALC